MTGRNEICPCGSGKKYKRCCLAKQYAEELAQRAETKRRLEEERKRAAAIREHPEIMTPEERARQMKVLSVMAVTTMMSGQMPRIP